MKDKRLKAISALLRFTVNAMRDAGCAVRLTKVIPFTLKMGNNIARSVTATAIKKMFDKEFNLLEIGRLAERYGFEFDEEVFDY